jgi:hypothetical protein
MADTPALVYRVFLLRCWQEPVPEGCGDVARRFSLEDPATGRRHGFTRAADLVAFLERTLDQGEDIALTVVADAASPE